MSGILIYISKRKKIANHQQVGDEESSITMASEEKIPSFGLQNLTLYSTDELSQ